MGSHRELFGNFQGASVRPVLLCLLTVSSAAATATLKRAQRRGSLVRGKSYQMQAIAVIETEG